MTPRPVVMTAWCFRDGVVHFSEKMPKGAFPLAEAYAGDDLNAFRKRVEVRSRRGYEKGIFLVPGVPEADTELQALSSATLFRRWFKPARGNDVH